MKNFTVPRTLRDAEALIDGSMDPIQAFTARSRLPRVGLCVVLGFALGTLSTIAAMVIA